MTDSNKSVELRSASRRILNAGLACNVALALAKTLAGIFGHSRALLADGINSTSDVVYYFAVKIFMEIAHKPADERHPYGHRQMESIAALTVGAFVITTAAALFWDSADDAFHFFLNERDNSPPKYFTLIIALSTILIKVYLYLFTKKGASKFKNPALMALAYDHRNDILSASAATLGIIFSIIGFGWFDPLAGAIVSILILKTGIKIIKESSDELMDTVPGEHLNETIKNISFGVDGIGSIEEVKAHRFGPYLVVNMVIGVDGGISVAAGDKIATNLEEKLISSIEGLSKVYVHFHPQEKITTLS
ncbi:MAG TPA: cation diffusion facilitator family transporter [Victivallales bacterium]|nr:cation diffusion facilitator family transporter [Victivallales bacterium]